MKIEVGPAIAFETWWGENFPTATAQSASFDEAMRCARLVWGAATAAERERCVRVCEAGMDGTHAKYAEACYSCADLIRSGQSVDDA